MSYETRYAAMMHAKCERARNSLEAAGARLRLRQAMNKAREDWKAKYPVITPENAAEALEYQGERIEFWRKELKA